MTDPKPLYSATMSYRTPAGRRVLYGSVVAAADLKECAEKLHQRLMAEAKYGRRRVAAVLNDFCGIYFAMQVARR